MSKNDSFTRNRYTEEIDKPYVLLHSIAFNQRCDSGRSKAFPMRGKATGPGGYGSARFRRNVTRQTRTEAAATTSTNEICITPRWEWTIGVDAGTDSPVCIYPLSSYALALVPWSSEDRHRRSKSCRNSFTWKMAYFPSFMHESSLARKGSVTGKPQGTHIVWNYMYLESISHAMLSSIEAIIVGYEISRTFPCQKLPLASDRTITESYL